MDFLPGKLARSIIKLSVNAELRDDVVVAFDELYEQVSLTSRPAFVWWWCLQQVLRSLPWRLIGSTLNFVAMLYKVAAVLYKAAS